MKCKEQIYRLLTAGKPEIQEKYQQRASGKKHGGRLGALLYLIRLNFESLFPERRQPLVYSESGAVRKESPQELAKRLAAYDVISFDVFDTLIFRPFQKPSDLFYLVGGRVNYLDFCRLRIRAEQLAREKKFRKQGHTEVSFEEIYEEFETFTGCPAEAAKREELTAEEQVCFANPYLLDTVEELRKAGKRIIAISDMYLSGAQIQKLLELCGYGKLDACYVSSDYQASKADGRLYSIVREKETGLVAHMGDHWESDIRQAKAHGFAACYYPNVNQAGKPFRAEGMSAITGSIYAGLVNAHLYNGKTAYGREYEYGFVYGGLLVLGYAEFIHQYTLEHPVDKILFLSRDGDILNQVYQLLYPQEAERCAYAYWSRAAAAKLASGIYKYDYFRRFLYHKADQGYTLKQILTSMDLETLLSPMEQELGFDGADPITGKNVEKVKQWMEKHWNLLQKEYEPQRKAGKAYYAKLLDGARTACAADVGWAGSGAVLLDTLVQKVWNLPCEITGLLAGTNSARTVETDMSEPLLKTGKLSGYLFSQEHNRELWNCHDPGKNHNLYVELLFSSPEPSLLRFIEKPDGTVEPQFGSPEKYPEGICKIQQGILDFTKQYLRCFSAYPEVFHISGRDAYLPVQRAMEDKKYIRGIFKEFELEKNVI